LEETAGLHFPISESHYFRWDIPRITRWYLWRHQGASRSTGPLSGWNTDKSLQISCESPSEWRGRDEQTKLHLQRIHTMSSSTHSLGNIYHRFRRSSIPSSNSHLTRYSLFRTSSPAQDSQRNHTSLLLDLPQYHVSISCLLHAYQLRARWTAISGAMFWERYARKSTELTKGTQNSRDRERCHIWGGGSISAKLG
jgi:hypothetical protein